MYNGYKTITFLSKRRGFQRITRMLRGYLELTYIIMSEYEVDITILDNQDVYPSMD